VRDGHVFEGDVELVGALEQVSADAVGDGFALRDEFGGVELRDDGFEDFVANGGEDALVVVEAEVLVGVLVGSPLEFMMGCHNSRMILEYMCFWEVRGRTW
jgi:hypothetical protein